MEDFIKSFTDNYNCSIIGGSHIDKSKDQLGESKNK